VAQAHRLNLEVIVQGKKVVVLVNGTKTAEASIEGLADRGPIYLNADAPGTVIHFRRIEIKPLPPTPRD
jgi:flagellar motor protein MotB